MFFVFPSFVPPPVLVVPYFVHVPVFVTTQRNVETKPTKNVIVHYVVKNEQITTHTEEECNTLFEPFYKEEIFVVEKYDPAKIVFASLNAHPKTSEAIRCYRQILCDDIYFSQKKK